MEQRQSGWTPELKYDAATRTWFVSFSETVQPQPIALPMQAVATGNNPYYTPTIMAAFRAYKEAEYGGKLPDEAFRLGYGQYAAEPHFTQMAIEFRLFKAGAEWVEEFRRADAAAS